MEVNGQLRAPAALPPVERAAAPDRRLDESRAGLDTMNRHREKSLASAMNRTRSIYRISYDVGWHLFFTGKQEYNMDGLVPLLEEKRFP
jgi:hypothetical protein